MDFEFGGLNCIIYEPCQMCNLILTTNRATVILGYLPQELLGTSVYEYYHQEDIPAMGQVHRKGIRLLKHQYFDFTLNGFYFDVFFFKCNKKIKSK